MSITEKSKSFKTEILTEELEISQKKSEDFSWPYFNRDVFYKCNENDFIYSKSKIASSIKDNLIFSKKENFKQQFNKNKLNIKYEDLYIETKTGYQIHLNEKFYLNSLLGEGGFGVVIDATCKQTNNKMAIKIISKGKNPDSKRNEFKIQYSAHHPNIVELYSIEQNELYFFLFMELMEGGSLKDYLIKRYYNYKENLVIKESEKETEEKTNKDDIGDDKNSKNTIENNKNDTLEILENITEREKILEETTSNDITSSIINENERNMENENFVNKSSIFVNIDEVKSIMFSLLEALKYLHSKNIVHRDIKPENLLLKKKNNISIIKLSDFGLSMHKYAENEVVEKFNCGTYLYMSPEIAKHNPLDSSLDIWASGILLYILISGGRHPLYSPRNKFCSKKYLEKLSGTKNWSNDQNLPLLGFNLFKKMCRVNKISRYDCVIASQHPFLTSDFTNPIPKSYFEKIEFKSKIGQMKSLLLTSVVCGIIKKAVYDKTPKKEVKKVKNKKSNIELMNEIRKKNAAENIKLVGNKSSSLNLNNSNNNQAKSLILTNYQDDKISKDYKDNKDIKDLKDGNLNINKIDSKTKVNDFEENSHKNEQKTRKYTSITNSLNLEEYSLEKEIKQPNDHLQKSKKNEIKNNSRNNLINLNPNNNSSSMINIEMTKKEVKFDKLALKKIKKDENQVVSKFNTLEFKDNQTKRTNNIDNKNSKIKDKNDKLSNNQIKIDNEKQIDLKKNNQNSSIENLKNKELNNEKIKDVNKTLNPNQSNIIKPDIAHNINVISNYNFNLNFNMNDIKDLEKLKQLKELKNRKNSSTNNVVQKVQKTTIQYSFSQDQNNNLDNKQITQNLTNNISNLINNVNNNVKANNFEIKNEISKDKVLPPIKERRNNSNKNLSENKNSNNDPTIINRISSSKIRIDEKECIDYDFKSLKDENNHKKLNKNSSCNFNEYNKYFEKNNHYNDFISKHEDNKVLINLTNRKVTSLNSFNNMNSFRKSSIGSRIHENNSEEIVNNVNNSNNGNTSINSLANVNNSNISNLKGKVKSSFHNKNKSDNFQNDSKKKEISDKKNAISNKNLSLNSLTGLNSILGNSAVKHKNIVFNINDKNS